MVWDKNDWETYDQDVPSAYSQKRDELIYIVDNNLAIYDGLDIPARIKMSVDFKSPEEAFGYAEEYLEKGWFIYKGMKYEVVERKGWKPPKKPKGGWKSDLYDGAKIKTKPKGKRGWKLESVRHSLARKGIKTGRKKR